MENCLLKLINTFKKIIFFDPGTGPRGPVQMLMDKIKICFKIFFIFNLKKNRKLHFNISIG